MLSLAGAGKEQIMWIVFEVGWL